MTQRQYIINRKLNILELGATLGNISAACRKLGVSRQHFYDIRDAIKEEGLGGLMEKTRTMPRIGNRLMCVTVNIHLLRCLTISHPAHHGQ